MFAEIQFTKVNVEAVLADYVIRGVLHSRGEVLNFLNDRRYSTFSLYDCELHPLSAERKIGIFNQDLVTIDKKKVIVLSVLDKHVRDAIQLTASKRIVIFYCGNIAIHGLLHVSADAPDEDILDEKRDFFGITDGSVYSLVPVGTEPCSDAPLMLLNRHNVGAYSVQSQQSQLNGVQ
jgi:hypothetical protein